MRALLGHVAAEHERPPAVGTDQRGQDPHRGGLAGTVGPEQPEHAADRHGERDALERLDGAEALHEVFRDDGRLARHPGGGVVHADEPSTILGPCPNLGGPTGRSTAATSSAARRCSQERSRSARARAPSTLRRRGARRQRPARPPRRDRRPLRNRARRANPVTVPIPRNPKASTRCRRSSTSSCS